MSLIQGNGGTAIGSTANQQNAAIAVGGSGDLVVSELMPRFYEATFKGNVFTVQFAAAALAAASATSSGNFALFNPVTSGRNVVLLDSTMCLVSFSAGTAGLQAALQPFTYTPTSQTALTPVNAYIGGPSKVAAAIPLSAGTLVGASTTAIKLVAGWYIDLAASDVVGSITYNFDGRIVLAPGSGIAWVAIATVPTQTVSLDVTWMEVPTLAG
jgi:hypothetical protein